MSDTPMYSPFSPDGGETDPDFFYKYSPCDPFSFDDTDRNMVSDGRIHMWDAVTYGVKSFFRNVWPWTAIGLCIFLMVFVVTLPFDLLHLPEVGMVIAVVVGLVFTIGMISASMQLVDQDKISFVDFFRSVRWVPIGVIYIFQGIVSAIVFYGLFFLLPGARHFFDALDKMEIPDTPGAVHLDAAGDFVDESGAVYHGFDNVDSSLSALPWGELGLTFAITCVVSLCVAPFISYMVYYVADWRVHPRGLPCEVKPTATSYTAIAYRDEYVPCISDEDIAKSHTVIAYQDEYVLRTIGEGIVYSIRDGAKHWWKLILFEVLITIIMFFIAIVSLGLLVYPLSASIMIARGVIYRQMSGGMVPREVVPVG